MKKIITVMLMLCCIIPFTVSNAHATTTFYMPFTEPTKNENSGYLNVCVRDTTTNKYHNLCIFWGLYGYVSNNTEYVDFHPQVEVKATPSGITLDFYTYSSLAESVAYHIGHCWDDGFYSIQKSGFTNGNYTYTYNFDSGRYVPQGLEVLGNGALISSTIAKNIYLVSWGQNNALIEAIRNEFANTDTILNNMSNRLNQAIINCMNVVSTVNSSIVSMNTNIANKIDSMSNALTSKLDELFKVNDETPINDSNNANSSLQGGVNSYDELENSSLDNFNSSLDNLNTENNLYSDNQFIATSQWVSTQLQNIYDSNIYISYIIDFGLILGIGLTLIGIKTKGG